MSAAATGTVPAINADREEKLPPGAMRVIWLLLAATFVTILNETTMGIAIPHLITDLSITATQAQWLSTAFMLTMGVIIPITGFLIQRWTTRSMFVIAMTLFSAGTAIAIVAPGFEFLVFARVVQASGSAMMLPLMITVLMTVVPMHRRGQMMGLATVVISLAPAIGPTVSGVILDTLNWRWIFGLVLPISIAALIVGAVWVTNFGERITTKIDALSVVLSAVSFGGIIFGLSEMGAHDKAGTSNSVVMITALCVGGLGLLVFIWRQLRLQRTNSALLDLRIFRFSTFTFAAAQMAFLSLVFFGTITILPLYLQKSHGLSAAESGLVVLPSALLMGLSGPIVGRIYDRYGARVLVIPGAISFLVACVMYLLVLSPTTPVWVLVSTQLLLSLGLSLSFPPLFTASLAALPGHLYSYGSATINTLQQVFGAASVAVMVAIVSISTASHQAVGESLTVAWAEGTRSAFFFGIAVGIVTLIGSFFVRKPTDTPPTMRSA